jgi:folate-binding protein YgfZ
MQPLHLHQFHGALGARFGAVGGAEAVMDYGDPGAEYMALQERAAVMDLSFRSRLCVTGTDRVRFLHGQVTNDIKRLQTGEGCYAALVNAKGRMESDLNVYCLVDELLLDFEPGLAENVLHRLEKYIVADDVQAIDVGPLYGLLSVQGPQAGAVIAASGVFPDCPEVKYNLKKSTDPNLGELYLMNLPRLETSGFDLFLPADALGMVAEKLTAAVRSVGGGTGGWEAFEAARIEAGIPRFGMDMDGSNFPQECGIEASAVNYIKGCYIGQEVLNRIHTLGHVNRGLRGLRLARDLKKLPARGDKLFHDGKEAGWITSALASTGLKENIALGMVRNEAGAVGTELKLRTAEGESGVCVVSLPFGGKQPEGLQRVESAKPPECGLD